MSATPGTAAGRALLAELRLAGKPNERLLTEQTLAIEAEAAAAEREHWLPLYEALIVDRAKLPIGTRKALQTMQPPLFRLDAAAGGDR